MYRGLPLDIACLNYKLLICALPKSRRMYSPLAAEAESYLFQILLRFLAGA